MMTIIFYLLAMQLCSLNENAIVIIRNVSKRFFLLYIVFNKCHWFTLLYFYVVCMYVVVVFYRIMCKCQSD